MFGITLRRSAATLGVVAGLLAAAAPARADNAWGPIVYVGTDGGGLTVGSEGVEAPEPPASSEKPIESISSNHLKAAGTETGNPERKGSINASGGWDPTHALNSQGVTLHAVATTIVGGLVPGGAIVSA